MRRKLFTIGYTGYSISDFVATLREHGVECLLDIRELPVSRKAGFSKSSLRQHLEEAGIEYHHLRWLGSPRALRHEVRESGDYVHFFQEFTTISNAPSRLRNFLRPCVSLVSVGRA